MNTETKINETKIFLISNNGSDNIEIKKLDFLDYYVNDPVFHFESSVRVGVVYNITLDVATYDNLKYLSVYIKYNYSFREFLILNCDVELLIEILKAKTKHGKNISDNVLSLFDDKDLKYIDRYINRNKDVAEKSKKKQKKAKKT